jgi:peptide-methionine (S)-S-oxide reductase
MTPPKELRLNSGYYHQQYLSDNKNPHGYCPDHGTGVSCPIGVVKADG